MSRRVQPIIITVICDGCKVGAPPDPLGVLTDSGWTISYDEPSGCDWCPKCTLTRSDLVAVIQSVRDVYEDYFHDRSDLDAVESLEAIRRALDGPQ